MPCPCLFFPYFLLVQGMSDLAEHAYRGFVCVEPLTRTMTLRPARVWRGRQYITIRPARPPSGRVLLAHSSGGVEAGTRVTVRSKRPMEMIRLKQPSSHGLNAMGNNVQMRSDEIETTTTVTVQRSRL